MKTFMTGFLVLTAICLAFQVLGYLKYTIESRFENRGKEHG